MIEFFVEAKRKLVFLFEQSSSRGGKLSSYHHKPSNSKLQMLTGQSLKFCHLVICIIWTGRQNKTEVITLTARQRAGAWLFSFYWSTLRLLNLQFFPLHQHVHFHPITLRERNTRFAFAAIKIRGGGSFTRLFLLAGAEQPRPSRRGSEGRWRRCSAHSDGLYLPAAEWNAEECKLDSYSGPKEM